MNRHTVTLLVCTLISLPACSQKHVEVGDWCIPQEFISPANAVSSDLNDENFDESSGDLAILYFEADYVSERVDGYSAQVEVAEGLTLTQALHVNIHEDERGSSPDNTADYRAFSDSPDLVTADPESSVEWEIYHQSDGGAMDYWGVCHDNFQGGFTCLRTLQFKEVNFTYNLENTNLSAYSQVDELLEQKFEAWRCGSK